MAAASCTTRVGSGSMLQPSIRVRGSLSPRTALLSRGGALSRRGPLSLAATTETMSSSSPSTSSSGSPSSPSEAKVPWNQLSYGQQYDLLYQRLPLDTKRPVPKPSRAAQRQDPQGRAIPFSDVVAITKKPTWLRDWTPTDIRYGVVIGAMHLGACLAPFTFSWPMLALFVGSYFVTGCLGITMTYHRMLSHKSFTTPKWLEYILAYCGVLAVQGDPMEWASSHRYHHLHTETPLDPHSIYEGFFFSHMGWLLDNKSALERVGNRGNVADMEAQPFYRFMRDTYTWHIVAMFAALYVFGGLPAMVWGGALRVCWVWHITWFVNSACHVWGSQTYNSGDESRNNWWVGLLAFGEGWHNNHHAFEFSARHGLEPQQLDITWLLIRGLELAGLASNVKLPTQRQMDRLRISKQQQVEAGGKQ